MTGTNSGEKAVNAIILIRIMLGFVFITEGIQKFLFADQLGVGRFTTIGIPIPEFSAPFVGIVEIVCGFLILIGLYSRLATIPVIISMLVAILTTKIPMLLHKGFWTFAHESRTDLCMVLGLVYILIAGGGGWSIDRTKKAGK
jgi:putative oxidoreductase